jgi:hypothetical protein
MIKILKIQFKRRNNLTNMDNYKNYQCYDNYLEAEKINKLHDTEGMTYEVLAKMFKHHRTYIIALNKWYRRQHDKDK